MNESFVLLTKRYISWSLMNMSHKAIITYNALLYFYNPTTNMAWPTLEILGHYTGYSRSTLSGSIKELIQKEMIQRTKRWKGNTYNNVYKFITIRDGKVMPPMSAVGEVDARAIIKGYVEGFHE